jgi:hypothetical protein
MWNRAYVKMLGFASEEEAMSTNITHISPSRDKRSESIQRRTRERLAALLLVAILAAASASGAAPRCRRLCRDEVRACVAAGGRPPACRRETLRRCRREGLQACQASTTTTSVTVTTTTATICMAGVCRPSCGPAGGCPWGEYCIFPPGDCGRGGAAGVCSPRNGGCPAYFDPVCGCDGRTYGNACEAAIRGVSVRHGGPCEAP